jgi:hypothetical protein
VGKQKRRRKMVRTEYVYIDDYLQDMNIVDVYEVEAPLVEDLKNLKMNTKGEQLELFTTKRKRRGRPFRPMSMGEIVNDELNFLNLKGSRFRMELRDATTGGIINVIDTQQVNAPIILNIEYISLKT